MNLPEYIEYATTNTNVFVFNILTVLFKFYDVF